MKAIKIIFAITLLILISNRLALANESITVYNNAINSLMKGDTGEAIILYEKAVIGDPVLLAEPDKGLMSLLLDSYKKAIVRNPEDFFLHYKLGIRYMLAGQPENALLSLQTFITAMESRNTETVAHAKTLIFQIENQKKEAVAASSSPFAATGDKATEPLIEKGLTDTPQQSSTNSKDQAKAELEQKIEEKKKQLEELKQNKTMYTGLHYTTADPELATTFDNLQYLFHNKQSSAEKELENLENQLNSL